MHTPQPTTTPVCAYWHGGGLPSICINPATRCDPDALKVNHRMIQLTSFGTALLPWTLLPGAYSTGVPILGEPMLVAALRHHLIAEHAVRSSLDVSDEVAIMMHVEAHNGRRQIPCAHLADSLDHDPDRLRRTLGPPLTGSVVQSAPADPGARDWYFTFGSGQFDPETGVPLVCRYVVIHGTYRQARDQMVARWGTNWSFQYDSAESAGVAQFHLVRQSMDRLADRLRAVMGLMREMKTAEDVIEWVTDAIDGNAEEWKP